LLQPYIFVSGFYNFYYPYGGFSPFPLPGLKSLKKKVLGFPGRQLKLTVKEERIPANLQLRSALPVAVLLFSDSRVAASTTRGGSSFYRRISSSQNYLWQFFFLPSA
jgi:hypothetical protein